MSLSLLLFSNQPSNQDIGDPAVAVTRPCPDGIKSNTSLMPQPLQATAVLLHVYELPCDRTSPPQISEGNPVVGEVTQSSGRDQGENSWGRICKAAQNHTADLGY